jgi:PBP1b-binding outer membrane lipoprotein LpoB
MKRLRLLAMMLLTAVLFAACSKDTTEPSNPTPTPSTPTKTPKELFIGTWKIESSVSNGANTLPDCSRDNLITFKADGSYTSDQGTVKCDPTDPQNDNGTWNLDAYPKLKYKLNTSVDYETVTIQTLDATTLIYTQYESDPFPFTITWKRQ